MSAAGPQAPRELTGLADLLRQSDALKPRPVESWDPPYCGDIGLAIRHDGCWLYRASPITRPALVKLFASILKREADGRYYLVTPVEKVDVAVADAPFLATEMEVRGLSAEQVVYFKTNVEDVVCCGAQHPLRFHVAEPDGGLKPYVHIRGRLEARLTRALTIDLVDIAEPQPAGRLGVWSGGVCFALPAVDV